MIGDGSFSKVKLAYHILTNQPYAIKIIPKKLYENPEVLLLLQERLQAMLQLEHPGICKLYEYLEDEESFYLVFEFCQGGELFDFIIKRSRVEEPLAKRFFKQICLSVAYLHSKNIVHRDLKPENILLTDTNTAKIIDFGLSNVHADQPITDRCGSSCYIAPEALTTTSYYGQGVDVWALGVILYTLVDGSLPWNYKDADQMFLQITTGDFPMPQAISIQCQDLIHGILTPDPALRLNLDAILMHPWLFGIGNVFSNPKPQAGLQGSSHLNLAIGRFSASDVHTVEQAPPPPTPLEASFTLESLMAEMPEQMQISRSRSTKPVQPRSISLNTFSTDVTNDGTPTTIMSQTITRRDPLQVTSELDASLLSHGITFEKVSPLIYQLHGENDMLVSAEICRLSGFRNVFIITFKQVQGDNFGFSQFVSPLLQGFRSL